MALKIKSCLCKNSNVSRGALSLKSGEIFRNKTKCQHLPGNRSRNSHGNFRDEFDGTHGIQLVAIEIFSCLVRNFFFVKMCDDTFVLFEALHRTESELLRSGPSQRTGRSAVVYGAPRSEAPKFVVRNEDERRFVFTKVLSIFPVNLESTDNFFGKCREFLVNKYA